MRKSSKKMLSFCLAAALTVTGLSGFGTVMDTQTASAADTEASTNDVTVDENPLPFRDLDQYEIVEEMGAGINLGNTFDGHTNMNPAELQWQSVKTTKKYIKTLHDAGYNTLRVPVTWGNMINDDYSVKETWMSRIQDVVDYAIEQDMYVIINVHHDGADAAYWLNLIQDDENELAKVYEKFAGLWKTIATRFRNYDEHLIFSDMNEIHEGYDASEAETYIGNIMKANQLFVDTVRATGGNNDKRWLCVVPWNTNIGYALDSTVGFEMPDDSAGRVMLEVHDYDPSTVTLTDNTNGTFKESYFASYEKDFKNLQTYFVNEGYPVIIGEYGITDKDNESDRAYYVEGVNLLLKKYGLVGCYWDDGGRDHRSLGGTGLTFALWDREACVPWQSTVTYAFMRGAFNYTSDSSYTDIVKGDLETTALTGFDLSASEISMDCGEEETVTVSNITPADNNNVIVWKTDDAMVATVYNGKIRAHGIGTTTITASAQDGSYSKEITVNVTASADPEDETITADYDSSNAITVTEGSGVFLNASISAASTSAATSSPSAVNLYYHSEDDSVATVSTTGKVVGVSEGKTTITVMANTGTSIEIPVTVNAAASDDVLKLGLYVMYNDSDNSLYTSELGSVYASVQQAGTYTVKFDCSTDLSDEAVAAGVSTFTKMTSIYLKDIDVMNGNISKSIVASGKIKYTSIKLNGTELALTSTDSFDLIDSSGVADSGGPINAWEAGKTILGDSDITVNKSNYYFSFTNTDASVLEITFELSDLLTEDGSVFNTVPTEAPTETPTETAAADASVTETPAADTSATEAPASSLPKKNSTKTVSGAKYLVTKSSATSGTVTYVASTKKKAASVSIPSTVKINGYTFKVTAIQKNAFKGNKYLKKVTIGSNIKKIGAKAFYNAAKLKTVKINSKSLTSVGSKAFKGTYKKASVTVPKAKYAKYKKLLKKAGLSSKAKYKKK
ncbi:MAG: cellulase family glycosylhydrolase [Clostridiaceae bacterium]|nr:cellulase family glycosylhydrolase [Clostridiaceae bacterium]